MVLFEMAAAALKDHLNLSLLQISNLPRSNPESIPPTLLLLLSAAATLPTSPPPPTEVSSFLTFYFYFLLLHFDSHRSLSGERVSVC